jgi:hypothetical protein
MMRRLAVLFALTLAVVLVAAPAFAQTAVSVGTTASVDTTAPYALDFTLPTEGKAGCSVCHGDPDLTRLRNEVQKNYYVDPDAYASSTHGETQCVGCHIEFGYKAPHDGDADWQATAKAACKNCHEEQFLSFGEGAHRRQLGLTGGEAQTELEKPLCGDCHGSHFMETLTDNPEGKAAIRARGWEVCGTCHEDTWASYDDYYHGAAYKRGAKDAPACWDCHGWHDILPSSDRNSRVNEIHLVETCGQTGCHTGVDENYVEYAAAIHGKRDVKLENPIYAAVRRIYSAIAGLFGGK